MESQTYSFSYEVFDSIKNLSNEDAELLEKARKLTKQAYAPYSHFQVAAVARTVNGQFIEGTNQENASFPAGICAERVLLSTASSICPDEAIISMAISYHQENGECNHPISPCGICRQSLQEYEQRLDHPIRLILGGMTGKIFIIPTASYLLPLAFTKNALG